MPQIRWKKERERLRAVLEGISSGEIVVKQGNDRVIKEIEERMSDPDVRPQQHAAG